MFRAGLILLLLASACGPLEPGQRVTLSALTVGSEHVVDDDVTVGAAYGLDSVAALASNGSLHLLVWEDRRRGRPVIYAARVEPDGDLLDPVGFPITVQPAAQMHPTVASDGSGFFVAWQSVLSDRIEFVGSRVAADGTVLDPSPLLLGSAPVGTLGRAGYGAGQYLVAWGERLVSEYDVRGARVATDGTVLDPGGFAISTAPDDQLAPSIAFSGGVFLAVWQDSRGGLPAVYGSRIDTSGVVLEPGGIAIEPAFAQIPVAAGDGTQFLVLWNDNQEVWARAIDSAGALLGAGETQVTSAPGPANTIALTFDGANFWAAWCDYRLGTGEPELYGTALTVAGSINVVHPAGAQLSQTTTAYYPAIAAAGGLLMTAFWDSSSGLETDIVGSAVTLSGSPLQPAGRLLSQSVNAQREPDACFTGAFHWAAWVDSRTERQRDIWMARTDAAGAPLDAHAFQVTNVAGVRAAPRLACTQGSTLAVFTSLPLLSGVATVEAARIGPDGSILGGPLVLGTTSGAGSVRHGVATNGTDFLAVWETTNGPNSELRAARISSAGTVIDPGGILVSSSVQQHFAARALWDGAQWIVYWSLNVAPGEWQVFVARLTSGGGVVDPGGEALTSGPGIHFPPRLAVAEDGTFLAVWTETFILNGMLIRPDGTETPLPAFVALVAGTMVWNFALAYDGVYFWVTWASSPDVASSGTSDLFAVRFDTNGQQVDAVPLLLSDDQETSSAGALSGDGMGNVVFFSEGIPPSVGAFRIRSRALLADVPPVPPAPLDPHRSYSVGWRCGVAGGEALSLLAFLVLLWMGHAMLPRRA